MTSIDIEPNGGAAGDDRMSDDAVRARTGRDWGEWFAILDAAGGATMTHKEIVALLAGDDRVGPWWQQMVTVTYEKARGLRARHQMADGYQISRSRTIAAPAGTIYAHLSDEAGLAGWVGLADITMRKRTPEKTIRFALPDGTPVEIYLTVKEEHRTSVTVQHSKLPDADEAARMKEFWGTKLELLMRTMEG